MAYSAGAANLGGWNIDVPEGLAHTGPDPTDWDMVYIENNEFRWRGNDTPDANAALQMYYGARVVFRGNRLYNTLIDCHGDNTAHSGRWWEFYDNDFYVSKNSSQLMQLRGGSGVVFNNRLHNEPGAAGGRVIKTWTETGGLTNPNPAPCQIGRGRNTTAGSHTSQLSNPAHIWNNTVINDGGGTGGFGFSPEQSIGQGQEGPLAQSGRDYKLNAKTIANGASADYEQAGPHPLAGVIPPPVDTVAPPVISPAAGSYYSAQTISMTQPTSGASYYYTTDGSEPTSSSTRYTTSFSLSSDAIVRAIGIKSGSTNSSIPSSAFDFSPWTVTGANVWDTFTVPQQTSPFTAAFRVRTNSAVSDSVVGLGAAPIAANANLEANLLFSINGVVQVRDGGTYVGSYPYQADTDYDISMVIDPGVSTNQIQSVSITPVGGSTTVLGTNFDFRNGATATELDNFGFRAGSAAVTITVSNLTLTPAATPAGTYYVSKDSGNNANPGTLASPWATIGYAKDQISGGDTIIVREATTPYNEYLLNITGDSGTAAAPTTIKAYPGETPSLTGPTNVNYIIAFTGVQHWLVEGLEMSGPNHCIRIRQLDNPNPTPDVPSSNITVRNCNLHDTTNQLVFVHGVSSFITLENNTMSNPAADSTAGFNGEAFYIGSHNGIDTYPDPDVQDFTNNIIIRGNTIDNCKHEAIDIKHDVHDVLIEDNVISNSVDNFEYGKWSILVNPEINYNANPNHIIRRNFISGQGGAGTGAAIGIATGAQVYNNVVFNVTSPAYAVEIIGGDAYTRYLWNNTLDIPTARAINFSGGTSSIGNNIGPATSGSNLAFNSALFVNATIHDYHLVAGSAGATPPFTISDDFDRVTRAAPPDIGAFEFVGAAPDTTAPIPNPSTFEVAPEATGPNAITMTATEASDTGSPPVQYYFEETTGNAGATDSGWQSSPIYADSGLSPNTAYSVLCLDKGCPAQPGVFLNRSKRHNAACHFAGCCKL